MIYGESVYLRQVKNIDIPKLMEWENNAENWMVSETTKPYSFEEIRMLVDSAEDIFESNQLRFVIVQTDSEEAIGTVDLFNVNFSDLSAHVGILIAKSGDKRKGFGKEAIELTKHYLIENLNFQILYCSIQTFNKASFGLFTKCGFKTYKDDQQCSIFGLNFMETINMCLCLKK